MRDAAVTLVDYGVGNIRAFATIFSRLGVRVVLGATPEAIEQARRLILPGVGAFDWAMARLNASGLRPVLERRVLREAVPVLGVCVGFQMMARRSEEGTLPGLGWMDAEVVRFSERPGEARPLPHMGWNDVSVRRDAPLFRGLAAPRFYFLHSYYVRPDRDEDVAATTRYGIDFAAAAQCGTVSGTQFHPEKSHRWGIDLLANFVR